MITPDVGIVPGQVEGVGQLEEGLGPEGVAPLGTADRQLGDALPHLVANVRKRPQLLPFRRLEGAEIVERIMGTAGDHGVHGDLRYRPVPELVALDLPGGAGFVDTLRAVWDTGDAVAPLDPRLPAAAREALLEALRPSRVVASDGEQHVLAGGMPIEDGDALVVATSGSSGQPKGVVLTHDALLASARATSERLGVDPARHSWLACLPLAHIGGLSVVTRALLTGTPLTVLPGFDADAVEELGRSDAVTHVSLVAAALRRLDPSVFTGILLGGSRPPGELPRTS